MGNKKKRREEGEEKKGDLGAGKQEPGFCIKLKKGILVGERGGPCTPVLPWKMIPLCACAPTTTTTATYKSNDKEAAIEAPNLSARKLGAILWELQVQEEYRTKMKKGGLLRPHSYSYQSKDKEKDNNSKALEDHHHHHHHLADPRHIRTFEDQEPASVSSLRRQVAASLIHHHKSLERNGRALQPLSPASCSSMEVATYNQVITPTSSVDLKLRPGEAGYSLKTSTELLKVLNRIWSLEEQHVSNVSLVKALKLELDHARVRIQELMQEQQADRHEIDDLMKQVAEDKHLRKTKEQDRIRAAVQSVRDELEDERKLRRRSESLHRKLAKELGEVKSAFSKVFEELGWERKTRVLLEDLCDELAKRIGEYEVEVRGSKHGSEIDRDETEVCLVVHIAKAWVDERVQMKLANSRHRSGEKNLITDRLRCEIESFLQVKQSHYNSMNSNGKSRRRSLESIHLNGATSAPQDAAEEDSVDSDLRLCFELNKNATDSGVQANLQGFQNIEPLEERGRLKSAKPKSGSGEKIRYRNVSRLQVQFDKVDSAQPCDEDRLHADLIAVVEGDKANQNSNFDISQTSDICDAQEGGNNRKGRRDNTQGSITFNCIDNLIGNQKLFSEGNKTQPETVLTEDSCGHSSWMGSLGVGRKDISVGEGSVQQWRTRQTSPDLQFTERSSRWVQGTRENTLKAKLMEARLEGQQARLRTLKASFSSLSCTILASSFTTSLSREATKLGLQVYTNLNLQLLRSHQEPKLEKSNGGRSPRS
ncbi:uncharacterized protein At5g41620 isoform X1 [Amborella trichopoda]|uniref:uncharacterized protein At5g41620 isoform X1 n=1 Tax=Amborella trichopoda TaxID=13333 RepID=UPI0009BEF411|nr:uncharacterized protein At5g41620 isoform X1 [Amborella trichopoda]|eukprot:XP_020520318.1 uncharacterized protein At5g41620 isoform X1 [Amborella trichopoda]